MEKKTNSQDNSQIKKKDNLSKQVATSEKMISVSFLRDTTDDFYESDKKEEINKREKKRNPFSFDESKLIEVKQDDLTKLKAGEEYIIKPSNYVV